jgi:DNA-directed RNA polymerase subunit M/transcription elongation factor TFIIS
MASVENEIRKQEKCSIIKSCQTYILFQKLDIVLKYNLVSSIEKSILNSTIDKAYERNVPVYWNNSRFIEQYSNNAYKIKINLDIESSVNRNKDYDIKTYLISRLYNFMIVTYLKKLYNKKSVFNDSKKPSFHLFDFNKTIMSKILSYIMIINPKNIGYIELNPNINQEYINELYLRTQQNIDIRYSKMYTCPRCYNKKAQAREIQTRSSDEGGTLFITCLVCNITWRQY